MYDSSILSPNMITIVVVLLMYVSSSMMTPRVSSSTPLVSKPTTSPVVASNIGFNIPDSTGPQYLVSSDDKGNIENTLLTTDAIYKQFCPVGTIMLWSSNTAPDGWLLCDGSEYPSTIDMYKKLFDVIKNTYGGVNPKFKVPDLRGRFPIGTGKGDNLTNTYTLATAGGKDKFKLSVGNIPPHKHVSIENFKDNHGNWQNIPVGSDDGFFSGGGGWRFGRGSSEAYTTGSCSACKTDDITEHIPPYLPLQFIIKY